MTRDELLKLMEEVAQGVQSAQIQLRVHRNVLDYWGFGKLAREYRKAESDFGLSLDSFVQHALSLDRQIELTPSLELNIGQTVEEILVNDAAIVSALSRLGQSPAGHAQSAGRGGRENGLNLTSAVALASPIFGELELLAIRSFARVRMWQSFIEKQLELVRQMGVPAYLSVIAEPNYRSDESNDRSPMEGL